MCRGCWEEYGKPMENAPGIKELVEAIEDVYEFVSSNGGPLHVILDDWNIDDDNVNNECYDEWVDKEEDDPQGLGRMCLDLLRAAPLSQRASALAFYDGFWKLDPAGNPVET